MTNYFFIVAKLSEEVNMYLSRHKKLPELLTRLSEIMTRDQNASASIKKALLKCFSVWLEESFVDKRFLMVFDYSEAMMT